jgi:hypothetical protein
VANFPNSRLDIAGRNGKNERQCLARTTFASERNPIMGDKGGKKDKDKSKKQKAQKQEQAKGKKPGK